MAPFIHLSGRPRAIGLAALVAASLCAIALGQVRSQPHHAPAAPRHTAVTIQRAAAAAAGQIAPPMKPLVLLEHRSLTGGENHRHKKGG